MLTVCIKQMPNVAAFLVCGLFGRRCRSRAWRKPSAKTHSMMDGASMPFDEFDDRLGRKYREIKLIKKFEEIAFQRNIRRRCYIRFAVLLPVQFGLCLQFLGIVEKLFQCRSDSLRTHEVVLVRRDELAALRIIDDLPDFNPNVRRPKWLSISFALIVIPSPLKSLRGLESNNVHAEISR